MKINQTKKELYRDKLDSEIIAEAIEFGNVDFESPGRIVFSSDESNGSMRGKFTKSKQFLIAFKEGLEMIHECSETNDDISVNIKKLEKTIAMLRKCESLAQIEINNLLSSIDPDKQ